MSESEQIDVESGFSDEEKREVREYIDEVSSGNRLPAQEAAFDRKSARPGLLIPLIVNGAAIVVVLVGVLILQSAFRREQAGVQNEAIEYASIEGRLIRELRAESQEQILEKEQEIVSIRARLLALEADQTALNEQDVEAVIAAREAELRAEIEAEIAAERARLIAEGLNNEEIDRLMDEFEAEREAFYQQQIAQIRAEEQQIRLDLQDNIDNLRQELNSRLNALEQERDDILAEFQEREQNLRVQLEQRTQVLELARVEATTDLEAAQRELAELEREAENVESIQNQIIGQIEAVQRAIVDDNADLALARIDALTAFLAEDQVLEIEEIARRRESDLFLLRQLRTLVLADTQTEQVEARSITQELRLIGQIRRLSEEAQGAPTEQARETFQVLLDTLPEVSQAHQQVVNQVRDEAVEEIRITEREIVELGTSSAATLVAAGDYRAALDEYVAALDQLPATSPDSNQIMSDVLRLGYQMTDFVIGGVRSADVDEIARRTSIDLDAERLAYEQRVNLAVREAVQARERQLNLEISRLEDEIRSLQVEVASAENRTPEEIPGFEIVPEAEMRGLNNELDNLARENNDLDSQLAVAEANLAVLESARSDLQNQLSDARGERDRLQEERAELLATFERYETAQARALSLATPDIDSVVLARSEFLASEAVDTLMPGFLTLMDQYDELARQDVQAVGLDGFLVSEVLLDLTGLTANAREAFIAAELEFAEEDGDQSYIGFLTDLREMLRSLPGAN